MNEYYRSLPNELQNYSSSFSHVKKEIPTQSSTINHELLIRGGFIRQEAAGLYTLLPFGKKVVSNIENLIRKEIKQLGAEEIQMPVLQPRENWDITSRWDKIDVLYQLTNRTGNKQYALAATSEEVVVPVVKDRIHSYKDLPLAVFQIGEKFRDEKRAKSGIIRGREFGMKDMYSFHATRESFLDFYQKVKNSYIKIFTVCGIDVKVTEASGGDFTVLPTHEFHAISEAGEDKIVYCNSCTFSQNSEIATYLKNNSCPKCQGGILKEAKSIEIGHIFDLGDKFTDAFDLNFTNQDGQKQQVLMGCYGIGITRLLGTIVEIHHDNKGIIWPDKIAPYQYHIIGLNLEQEDVKSQTTDFIDHLYKKGFSLLFDDRLNVQAGEKFATADLIGIPKRIVISNRTLATKTLEIKERNSEKSSIVPMDEFLVNI